MESKTNSESKKRKRGRPVTKIIPPLRATPEEVVQRIMSKPALQQDKKR